MRRWDGMEGESVSVIQRLDQTPGPKAHKWTHTHTW